MYLRTFLFAFALSLISNCSLNPDDEDPVAITVRFENRSSTPVSIIASAQESFSDASRLTEGRSRIVRIDNVRTNDDIFFEVATRDGDRWLELNTRTCTFDGDLDKSRIVFYLGGLGCENW